MSENNIHPEKITKPIQLLAAWLTGLVLLETALLTAAGTIKEPNWLPALFGISAVLIIPLFLLMIFLLQTRFRPEMQEDSYYAKYLDRNSMTFEVIDQKSNNENELIQYRNEIFQITQEANAALESIKKVLNTEKPSQQAREITEIVSQSDKKIEELKKVATFVSLDLRINNKLIKYEQIVATILKMGFSKFIQFGSDSVDTFIISFGPNVPIYIVKELTFELIPFGLQYIKPVTDAAWRVKTNTIYIGSYTRAEKGLEIGDALIQKLNNAPNEQRFEDFMKN